MTGTPAYQAVILAAGRGSRLSSHTRELPKALLPIGPRTSQDQRETNFLRRQVELLTELGVDNIVVVVGTLRHLVEEEVIRERLPVTLVDNPTRDMSTSGSLHSFQFAVRSGHGILQGTHQTLLMDGDIVYDRRALAEFFRAAPRTSLLATASHNNDQEEVRVYGTEQAPRFLGKALTENLVDHAPCLGEATGIVKFAPEDHALARETIDWMVGDPDAATGSRRSRGYGPAGMATEHEELTQRFMHYGRMRCVLLDADIPFMECDNADEYRRVRQVFYPDLLRRETP